jgi:hypothetical protein
MYSTEEADRSFQVWPPSPERCQRYAYEVGELDHVPGSAVSGSLSRAIPEIVGGVRLEGGRGSTTAVGSEGAGVDPPAFVAVTTTRSRRPRSSLPGA